jgi:hypothetical protein
MKRNDNDKIDERSDQEEIEDGRDPSENDPDFIQAFIERKKLQNRILKKIIEKIKPIDEE